MYNSFNVFHLYKVIVTIINNQQIMINNNQGLGS